MRVLKFKQAIYSNDRFHHWHYWGFLPDLTFVGPDSVNGLAHALDNSRQYTGLKDKTGKESYDQDIICYPNDYPQSYGEPPEPNNDIGEIYWNEKEAGFWARSGKKAREHEYMPLGQFIEEFGEFEIIGNKMEDPELLETK